MRCKKIFVLPCLLVCLVVVLCAAGVAWSLAGATSGAPAGVRTRTDLFLLGGYVFLALLFSFACSIAEAVLLSITPSFIADLELKHPRLHALLKRLKQDKVDQSLAAILTLNTIAHTVGAIGAGAKATVVFGSAWFGLFSAVMTLLILFVSEIVPKTLGAVYWRRLAWPTAWFVRGLVLALYPLIVVSEGLTRLIARNKECHLFSRDEFIAMACVGEQAGKILESETRIIRNLFRFNILTAKDIMTPRTVIQALQEDQTVGQALAGRPDLPFSRLPLFSRTMDDITSFVLKSDLLLAKAQGQDQVPLSRLKREMTPVTGEMSLTLLLEFLLDRRHHIALVVGEYGETMGLVTLEDVVETLLGMEIIDEMDPAVDMQALARKQWEKRAAALGLDLSILKQGKG